MNTTSEPIRLAVLLSGGGTTLQNFLDQIAAALRTGIVDDEDARMTLRDEGVAFDGQRAAKGRRDGRART